MTGTERPELSLGAAPKTLAKKTGGGFRPLGITIIALEVLILAALVAAGTGLLGPRGSGGLTGRGGTTRAGGGSDLKPVALALEERSLFGEAARAWEDYASSGALEEGEAVANLHYRAGTLWMQADAYGEAAAAFVRAETEAGKESEIGRKVGPKLVECLRKMGLYGEVGRELSRQVEVGAEGGRGPVVATFAGEELTEADVDRMIERRVDQMLAAQGMAGDAARRQALLAQVSSPETRSRLLQELIQTELFSRRARELGLDRSEDYRRARDLMESSLLAGMFLDAELAKIQPTAVDLEAYYAASEARYVEPESVTALLVELGPEDDAAALVATIGSAEDIRALATSRNGGEEPPVTTISRGRRHPRIGQPPESLFELPVGRWTETPLQNGERSFLVVVEGKSPERTPPLSEIEDRVRTDYVARKQQELSQQLGQELMSRYDVEIRAPQDATMVPPDGR